MDNYKTISTKVRNRENFKGNTMWGAWLNSTQYTIFSYSTPIAEIDTLTGKVWVNPRKYSVTTSKHQNIIRRAWGVN